MPYPSRGLSQSLRNDLDAFMQLNDMVELYRAYAWENDTYAQGFPDILKLELQLGKNARGKGVELGDAVAVAVWGAMRNQGRIAGAPVVLPGNALFSAGGVTQGRLDAEPHTPFATLQSIKGFGPTYQSKILRFALPEEYGAIDTRLARVFGQGDAKAQQHDWLDLKVVLGMYKGKPTGWSIPASKTRWPAGYSQWINILRYLATQLGNTCPHPEAFVEEGLRSKGRWTCADVEMALFCYASRFV